MIQTKPAAEHSHDGTLLYHSQVCQQCQLQPSSHSKSTHCCYQRLWKLQTGRTLEETTESVQLNIQAHLHCTLSQHRQRGSNTTSCRKEQNLLTIFIQCIICCDSNSFVKWYGGITRVRAPYSLKLKNNIYTIASYHVFWFYVLWKTCALINIIQKYQYDSR